MWGGIIDSASMAGLIVHAVYQRLVSTAHMRDIQSNKGPGSHPIQQGSRFASRSTRKVAINATSVQYECPIKSRSRKVAIKRVFNMSVQ